MALPTLRSLNDILKSMIQTVTFKSGVNDLNIASANRSLIEAAAMSDFRTQGDIMAALASTDIDNATGSDLDDIGNSKGVPHPQSAPSNGTITVSQVGFTKVSTKIYQGTVAPPAGSTTINIASITGFPPAGSVYLGRGTNNYEGPLPYSSFTQIGSFFQLNLSSPTTKNHNVGETVILSQGGNRTVQAGALAQTTSNLTSTAVTFKVLTTVTLLDGEDSLANVPVICTQSGASVGNVSAGSIVGFSSEPFPNAICTNPLTYTTGRDIMSDDDYRDLIKNTQQTLTKGTPLAVKQAAIGVQSTDDNQTVVSAEFQSPANRTQPGILYIDNGAGYEPIFTGQGFEQILSNANGGEQYLQLQNQDVVKAAVVSSFSAPFAVTGGMKLDVLVGGARYEHIFSSTDFATDGSAATDEVVNSINANSALAFSARAFNNDSQILIFAKAFVNEDIKVMPPASGKDANAFLGFSETLTYSLRLYKNDILLIKDGIIPTILSANQSSWNNSITNGATLKIIVDGTPVQAITINNADFVPFGYTSVSKNNSLASWAAVLNSKLAGVTVTVNGGQLQMVSNKGANSTASLAISSDISGNSLANGDGMWTPASVNGVASDYSFNRSTGQIQLVNPAVAGDSFTAGSQYTRGFINSASFPTGSLTLVASPAPTLYFIVDTPAAPRSVSLSNAVSVSVTNPSTNIWRYTFSVTGVISGVKKDDIVIITNNDAFSANNIGHWRVTNVDGTNTYFDVIKTLGTVEGPIALSGPNDITFINSPTGVVQVVTLPSGLQNLAALANSITSAINGITSAIINNSIIRLSTQSYSNAFGSLLLAAQNSTAAAIGFTVGEEGLSQISHVAFDDSQADLTFIEFFHDIIATGDNSAPYTSVTTTTNLDTAGFNPNNKVLFLNPYGSNISSNRKNNVDTADINGVNLTLRSTSTLEEIIANDRYTLEVPFDFNALDSLVTILDNDTINKTFSINMGRRIFIYNSPDASHFNAYDYDFGPTANFPNSFGNNFDFSDFKVHFKARAVLTPSGSNNQMMVRSVQYGPSGNRMQVGIYYPQSPSTALRFVANNTENTATQIFLSSGALRTGGSWDTTTQFDVTNPSSDIWRYTWNGTGTAPNFLAASIVTGDIVNISSQSTFSAANTGVYKLSNVTSTYFEITNVVGGFAETGKTLNFTSSLQFYPLNNAANTASLIGTFVNGDPVASLYISIAQLESGTGVVSTSTLDDTSSPSENLVDGENWILSSDVGTTISPINSFTLKKSLTISGANLLNEIGYLVPTRSAHLDRYLNVFAVTGLSSLGNLSVCDDAASIQIYSDLFGSSGEVLVAGGTANMAQAAINVSGAVVDSNYVKFSIPASAANGLQANQWIKFSNNTALAKTTSFNPTTQVSWTSNSPVLNESTIALANSSSTNVYENGYLWTKRYHDGDSTTGMRVERQGKFIALSWNGTGTAPNFTKTFTITNVARSSGVSTITLSTAHNVPSGNSMQITISGLTNSSFDGAYRATSNGTNTLQFLQPSQPNVSSVADSGSAVRQVIRTDRVVLSGAFNTANQGTFLIAGTFNGTTIYIENPIAVEEDIVLSGNSNIILYDYDSVMPGDTFSVGSTILDSSTPFESHKGSFSVLAQGASENIVIISSLTSQSVSAVTLGASFNTVTFIEASPFLMYAKIANMNVSNINTNNTDIVIYGSSLPSKITPSAGTGISAISKLAFDTNVQIGEDSYKYYGGLVHAVGITIRGDATDTVTYPGVAAAGSFIEVDAALPKRIQLSIVIRNKTGTPFTVVSTRVQSAAAAYVNSLGVGVPVVFSEIITAVQQLAGIQAVSIASPAYNSTNDQIVSQPNEKPLILNINTDILVSQAT